MGCIGMESGLMASDLNQCLNSLETLPVMTRGIIQFCRELTQLPLMPIYRTIVTRVEDSQLVITRPQEAMKVNSGDTL